jgi:hypothetical protein
MSLFSHPKLFEVTKFETKLDENDYDYETSTDSSDFINLSPNYHSFIKEHDVDDLSLRSLQNRTTDTLAVYVYHELEDRFADSSFENLLKLSIYTDVYVPYSCTHYLTLEQVEELLVEFNDHKITEKNELDSEILCILLWLKEAQSSKLGVIYSLT